MSFRSYPGGKSHEPREIRTIDSPGLGGGTQYIAYCGTRAVFWSAIFYQDRITDEPANCKSCNSTFGSKKN